MQGPTTTADEQNVQCPVFFFFANKTTFTMESTDSDMFRLGIGC